MPKGKPGSGRAGLIADLNFHKRVIGHLVEMVGVDRYIEAVRLARAVPQECARPIDNPPILNEGETK